MIKPAVNYVNSFNLPSGRVFLLETGDKYKIECTEMRDVALDGKLHAEVREATDPKVVWRHLVPNEKKWLLTVSTQKGCCFNCKFCDVAPLPYKGNLTAQEIEDQIRFILRAAPYVKKCDKVKLGFARMGEPAFNTKNVFEAMSHLYDISESEGRSFRWLPCFNSVLPTSEPSVIEEVIKIKESMFDGFLHFQVSCNSTDEEVRKELFGGGKVFSLEDVIKEVNRFKVTNRTVTLNFIVMDGIEVSVDKLKKMGLNRDKFAVKLIPLNKTHNSEDHDLKTYANYSSYEKLIDLRDKFQKEGIPVVVDAIAKCEEAGLCCGQLVGATERGLYD